MPEQDAIKEPEVTVEGATEGDIEAQAAKMKEGGEVEPAADEKKDDEPAESPKEKALKAELKRVRELNRERSSEITATNERLAKMEGRLEERGGGSQNKMASYSDRELVKLQMQWEDHKDTARAGNDAPGLDKAKSNIEAIRMELHERSTTSAAKASEAKLDEAAILDEAASLIKDAVEAWPDLQNEDSEIFQAAQAEFKSRPKVYKQLGVFADMVAVSAALSKNPKLAGTGRDRAVRKAVIKDITKAAEDAVHAGGGSAAVKTSVNVDNMSTEDIEAAAERIKAGGSLTKP